MCVPPALRDRELMRRLIAALLCLALAASPGLAEDEGSPGIGPAGARGPAGPPGPQGAKGDAGPAGAVGNDGPTGPVGAVGPAGPIGPKGDAGTPGAAGSAGGQGAPGPAGPAGAAGAPGAAGATGPAGPQGPPGPAGSTGAIGPAFASFAIEVASKTDCTFSVALPAGRFSTAPVVVATARKAGGRDYVVTLTAVSSALIAGQVRASRTMPAVISLVSTLAGYDTFACTATDLTPVDILALAPVP